MAKDVRASRDGEPTKGGRRFLYALGKPEATARELFTTKKRTSSAIEIILTIPPSEKKVPAGRPSYKMPLKSGRLEKRIRLAVPVEISTLEDPPATERTSTEDVCPIGARVVTLQPKQKNQRLVVRSLAGGVRTQARVVYCQRLSTGHFAIGLQFMGMRVKEW